MLYLYHVNELKYYDLKESLTIGRMTGDILFPADNRVSSKHAKISVETIDNKRVVYVEDLGSKNRTILNRTEIAPHVKTSIRFFALLEIGDQKFVLCETNNINLQTLGEMIDAQIAKSIIKLSPEQSSPPAPLQQATRTELEEKEASLLDYEKELAFVEAKAKSDILKIEETREKIISEAKTKMNELAKNIKKLTMEIQETKAEAEKIRQEVELKKKKVINLKDLDTK